MSATSAMLVIVLVWLGIGVVASLVMGRRGHHAFTWGALGAVLGPFVVPLALRDVRDERSRVDVLVPGDLDDGLHVLVGVDGSAEAAAAIDAASRLFGERIGRYDLATVVDFDSGASGASLPERARAEDVLASGSERVSASLGREPAQVVLTGTAPDALRDYAAANDVDVLVVGSRGHGASKHVFGSVATALTRSAPVPVIVVSTAAVDRRSV